MRLLLLKIMMLSFMTLAGLGCASTEALYVSPDGSDQNPGTAAAPFKTIQHAADVIQPGQRCLIREGVYRETVQISKVGASDQPVIFETCPGERAVIDGTDPVRGEWTVYKDHIYQCHYDAPVGQLFVDGKMMIEARWPNARFDQMLDPSVWAATAVGSRYGKIVDPNLAETGIDWTGALAVLNVAHQFYTWTREVKNHQAGADTLYYEKNLPAITKHADLTEEWEDDKYYLVGKLEALDAPTEWFYDKQAKTLYLYLSDGDNPTDRQISVKKRDYGFDVRNCDNVVLSGLKFFGCTFRFEDSSHCLVDHCRIRFPSYSRRITELDPVPSPTPESFMSGDNNAVRHTLIAYTPVSGLKMLGRNASVENCIIHDVDWFGNLQYAALRLGDELDTSEAGTPRAVSNTLYNAGNSILAFEGKGIFDIGYNHVFSGGMLCKDVSLIYTQWPNVAGSVIHHNWVHGCRPLNPKGGLGIRADDQARALTAHHNVVWDCGRDGIVLKGEDNKAYNNTIFDIGGYEGYVGNYINFQTGPEPSKPWRFQYPLLPAQNQHSLIANNAAKTITEANGGRLYSISANLVNNYQGNDLMLRDPKHFDFRPEADSPLVDAGAILPGITQDFAGAAPDIGAYEFGGEFWRAGADWMEK